MALPPAGAGDLGIGWYRHAVQSLGGLFLLIVSPVMILGYQAVISVLKSSDARH